MSVWRNWTVPEQWRTPRSVLVCDYLLEIIIKVLGCTLHRHLGGEVPCVWLTCVWVSPFYCSRTHVKPISHSTSARYLLTVDLMETPMCPLDTKVQGNSLLPPRAQSYCREVQQDVLFKFQYILYVPQWENAMISYFGLFSILKKKSSFSQEGIAEIFFDTSALS